MRQGFIKVRHRRDIEGRPEGGETIGVGFVICWQDGPLGKVGTSERKQPNGAFVEDIIAAAKDRLAFYNSTQFRCEENEDAMMYLRLALEALEARTSRRTAAKTEGTHEGN